MTNPPGERDGPRDSHAEIVLEAKHFSLALGGKEILRDVTLSVRRGEYVAIVGPNGAGKTTLLKCFGRLLSGGRGEVRACADARANAIGRKNSPGCWRTSRRPTAG